MSRPTWDEYFLDIAALVSSRSKDPRTKVGAVLVRDKRILGTGYNGFPSGVDDTIESRWVAPEKYFRVAHAESNIIDMCARDGVATKGATVYVTMPPCNECSKSIIQSGVIAVVIGAPAPAHWADNTSASIKMLEEAGVKVVLAYSEKV